MNQDVRKAWYVLTSKPRQDAYAEEQLNNQGYTTYRPLALRKSRHKGKLITVTESLFPRYLFINLDRAEDNWAPIRSTYGVSDFVRFGSLPAKVPDLIITDIQSRESSLEGQGLSGFQCGDNVTIGAGPFKGLQAIFERSSGEERAILFLNVLSQQTKVAIPVVDLYKTA